MSPTALLDFLRETEMWLVHVVECTALPGGDARAIRTLGDYVDGCALARVPHAPARYALTLITLHGSPACALSALRVDIDDEAVRVCNEETIALDRDLEAGGALWR